MFNLFLGEGKLVIPTGIALGLLAFGAQLSHLWMIDKSVRRNGSELPLLAFGVCLATLRVPAQQLYEWQLLRRD